MVNEKLEQAAHRYADLVKQVKDAARRADHAREELNGLRTQMDNAAIALKDFVGNNVSRAAIVLTGGGIVTIEHVSENCAPAVHVFENGEEIR
jgi:hypothetical protein